MDHKQKRSHTISLFPKTDSVTKSERKKNYPRSVSENESSNNHLNNNDMLRTNQIQHYSSRNNLVLSVPVTEQSETTVFQSSTYPETNFSFSESICHPMERENELNIPVTINVNSSSSKNSTKTSFISPKDDASTEITCETFSSNDQLKDIKTFSEHHYEEIDKIDSQDVEKYPSNDVSVINTGVNKQMRQKLDGIFNKSEEPEGFDNQRRTGNPRRLISTENEESKAEMWMCNKENDEDELWKSHADRPLLPLKPLQKQKSMSCTNLVQTLKGLSKRKKSDHSRYSSPANLVKNILFPEHAIVEKKERSTSEANIFSTIRESSASPELAIGVSDFEDYLEPQNYPRQSLPLNYAWFHPVDAKEASKRLLKMRQNGAFLIRPASNPTNEVLHTLCVVFSRRVYNFHVQNLKDDRVTLGKNKKHAETFPSLLDMIKYHQSVPITVNLPETNGVEYVYLLITPSK